jgi:hypothetical protein
MNMNISTAQRSEILSAIAEASGADVSKTDDRNAVRSVLVKILVDEHGFDVPSAFDIAWGAGAFEKTRGLAVEELIGEAAEELVSR